MQGANTVEKFLFPSFSEGQRWKFFVLCTVSFCHSLTCLFFFPCLSVWSLKTAAERKGCFCSPNQQFLCCNRKVLIHKRSIPYRNWGNTVQSPYFSNQINVSASTYLVSQTQKVSRTYITGSNDKKVSHYLPHPHFLRDQYS